MTLQHRLLPCALAFGVSCAGDELAGSGDDAGTVAADGEASGDDADGPTGAPSDPGPHSLVVPDGWALDDPAVAPMAADRPDPITCDVGWGLEDGVFEVDSESCNWGAFVQATREDIFAGDSVEVILLHDALFSADEGATAHLGAAIDGTVFWDTQVMIPSPPGFLRPQWTADADYPAGTPLHYHVHNHGYNNYRLVDVTVTPP